MNNVIWLDSSDRRQYLIDEFGKSGDWINSEMSIENLSTAAYVVAHFSDLKEMVEHNESETEYINLRIKLFKDNLQTIFQKKKQYPTIVVYSGEADIASYANRIPKWISKNLDNLTSIKPLMGVPQTSEGVNRLKRFILSETPEAFEKIEKEHIHQSDMDVAIDLVAEVVAWLETIQNDPPPEMKELTARLINNFGSKGERLVKSLVDRVEKSVESEVNNLVQQKVKAKKIDRLDSWCHAGMLTVEDKS